MPLSPRLKKLAYYTGIFAAVGIAVYIKDARQTDEQRAAINARYDSVARQMVGALDKTGQTTMAMLWGNVLTNCRGAIASSTAGTDADKEKYCECASLGSVKEYYRSLPASDLQRIASLDDPSNSIPASVAQTVYRNCSSSTDYYNSD